MVALGIFIYFFNGTASLTVQSTCDITRSLFIIKVVLDYNKNNKIVQLVFSSYLKMSIYYHHLLDGLGWQQDDK